MMLRITLATVTTKPGHQGEHEGNRKTIVQGMPVETGEPVEDYRIFLRPRVHRTPGIPCALYFLGAKRFANLGRSVSRERGSMSECHCEERSDEAIQSCTCDPGLL